MKWNGRAWSCLGAALVAAGCSRPAQVIAPEAPVTVSCPTCAEAKLAGGWCSTCEVGYVAGIRVDSELLFEAAHPHGHPVADFNLTCPMCLKAVETDGWCDRSGLGWANREAYVTELTWHLARGDTLDPAAIECDRCRANAETFGWCERCAVGMLGNVAVADESEFQEASRRFLIFLEAVEASGTCETCAAAMCTDTACHLHGVVYKDGLVAKRYERTP